MFAAYCFNSTYDPNAMASTRFPSLRLLEGGKFAPKEFAPVLVQEDERVRLKFFHWGIQSAKGNIRAIHATSFVNIKDLPAHLHFRTCLVPADGIYLELPHPQGKQTYKLNKVGDGSFCFAGIYRPYTRPDGSQEFEFSILTHRKDVVVGGYQTPMPLILDKHMERLWLKPNIPLSKFLSMLDGISIPRMHIHTLQELAAA